MTGDSPVLLYLGFGVVAGLGVVKDVFCSEIFDFCKRRVNFRIFQESEFGEADYAGSRTVLLKAASFAAAADCSFVVPDLHVADLSAGAVSARHDLAVDDDASADACSQSDHDDAVMSFAAAIPLFTQRRDIGVISDGDINAVQKIGQLLPDICNSPSQVHAHIDDAGRKNRTRYAYAHSLEIAGLNLVFLELFADRLRDIGNDQLSVIFLAGGNFPVFNKLSVG